MLQWKIGSVRVTRVVENEILISPRFMFGRSKAELLEMSWLSPHFITEAGLMKLSVHTLLVESEGRRIMVDTCVGNDKAREVPQWNQ